MFSNRKKKKKKTTIPISADDPNDPVFTQVPQENLALSIDTNSGSVTTTGSLDRELVPKYVFHVTVTDNKIPEFGKDITVTIIILDVNDNNPKPAKLIYNIEVFEDVVYMPPSLIETISATDADEGLNGAISYQILSGNGDNKFNLHVGMNKLTVIGQLDREVKDTYKLMCEARDQGMPKRKSVPITINIVVKDVNDNTPSFPNAVNNLVYPETQPLGNLHQLIATDLDIESSKDILYKLISGNEDGKFVLNVVRASFKFALNVFYSIKNIHQYLKHCHYSTYQKV